MIFLMAAPSRQCRYRGSECACAHRPRLRQRRHLELASLPSLPLGINRPRKITSWASISLLSVTTLQTLPFLPSMRITFPDV